MHEAINSVQSVWKDIFYSLYAIITADQPFSTSWMPLLSDKPWYPLQCDFSSMISPSMFDEFVLPALHKEAKLLSRSIFHLDGPGELPHLDSILKIEEINGIQWVPGAKMETMETDSRFYDLADSEWISLYRKIQASGRNLVLMNAHPHDVDRLLSKLSPEGLYISTFCDSQDDAEALLELIDIEDFFLPVYRISSIVTFS